MSSHYARPEEKLPDALIESIVKSKSAGQGLFNLRQLFHAKYDSEPKFRSLRCRCRILTLGGSAPSHD